MIGWISVEKEVKRATFVQTYRILNHGTPQEIATQMPMNFKSLESRNTIN